jgi:hypothetical protein
MLSFTNSRWIGLMHLTTSTTRSQLILGMEAVPLVTYQSAIQSVIISGNENRRIRIGLQGFASPSPTLRTSRRRVGNKRSFPSDLYSGDLPCIP